MNNIRNIEKINEEEFKLGIYGGLKKGSWHDEYRNSAWVFVGGLSFELSEGDVICVMSQWGEVDDIHLVRDKETQKPKGFAFIKYEDQRSTILAVDNFNGVKLLGRTLRVDHVDQYKLPKEVKDEEIRKLEEREKSGRKEEESNISLEAGHAYRNKELASKYNINKGVDLWKTTEDSSSDEDETQLELVEKKGKHVKKEKKSKKDKKKKLKKRHHSDGTDEKTVKKAKKEDSTGERDRPKQDEAKESRPSEEELLREYKQIHQKHFIPYHNSLPEGTVASWRGVRDPELHKAAEAFEMKKQKQEYEQKQKDLFPKKSDENRDEISGIGGYKRIR